jgi:hypothetical protein
MARYLFIVSLQHKAVYGVLRERLSNDAKVDVILDRRRVNRRRASVPCCPRTPQRRPPTARRNQRRASASFRGSRDHFLKVELASATSTTITRRRQRSAGVGPTLLECFHEKAIVRQGQRGGLRRPAPSHPSARLPFALFVSRSIRLGACWGPASSGAAISPRSSPVSFLSCALCRCIETQISPDLFP